MEEKEDEKYSVKEVIKRYNIDIAKLEKEQKLLAKQVSLKDSINFSQVTRIGGISNVFFEKSIVSAIVILDNNMEMIEQKYFLDRIKFPYLPEFTAYRELPAMVSCFNELEDKPEVIFFSGHGISHPRLGIASHFSVLTGIPTIGAADSLLVGEVKDENIIIDGKIVGKVIQTKKGGKPLYVSPGNMISLDSAVELVKRFVKEPHKLPEPLYISHKYAKQVAGEVKT